MADFKDPNFVEERSRGRAVSRQGVCLDNFYYGSGFTNGDPDAQYPGNYLPQHTTFDISLGKSFGESDKYRVSVTALNVANRHVPLDNSLTFGGLL